MGERHAGGLVVASAACVLALAVCACSGEDCCTMLPIDAAIDASQIVDAPPSATNAGFAKPTTPLAAWSSPSPNSYVAETLDLSCMNAARPDMATTTGVALDVTVRDYQSDDLVPSAQVAVFHGASYTSPFATATSDASGVASLTIPGDTKRVGFVITANTALPTYVLDRILEPSVASQTMTLASLSRATYTTLPALLGVTTMSDRTLAIGTMRDCQGHTMSGFIATISAMPGIPAHPPGAVTYYYTDAVDLPVRNEMEPAGTRNGLFMVIDVPATPTAYVQVWGYRDASDLATDTLTLIAELAIPVPASSVVLAEHDPRRTAP